VYLHFHGGGWTLGAAHHMDVPNLTLARGCGLAVVSVDYRLAPEHPYPAGPDDCEAAALWVVEHARREFGCDWLAIGGESAGAHLAVVTLVRLRERHGFQGFRAAQLAYGAYDLSLTPSVRRWGPRNLILSTPIIEWFTDQFVGPELRRHPDVSPLYADLAGLPPALLTCGTLDPLLDDSLFLHARRQPRGAGAVARRRPRLQRLPDRAGRARERAHRLVPARGAGRLGIAAADRLLDSRAPAAPRSPCPSP
jgi:acetyl esterase/lipase